MSLMILKEFAAIETARAQIIKKGIDILNPDLQRQFASQGHVYPIGDGVKSWDVLQTLNFIETHVSKDAAILDIGAYRSEVPCDLHLLGYADLYGIDLNPDVVRMPYCQRVRYAVANFFQTPFPAESLSAVTAISVIEHGFDGDNLLRELARVLKPGGYFIASIDYWDDKICTEGLTAFNMDWRIFSKEELVAFFEAAAKYGLHPVGKLDFETQERPVSWNERSYTFAWFALQKRGRVQQPTAPAEGKKPSFKEGERLGFVSTYNQECGIATHTKFMIDGLRASGARMEIFIFAEDAPTNAPEEPYVIRCWRRHGDDFALLKKLLIEEGITKLHLQFQIALYHSTDIMGLARFCRDAGIDLFVTFHSSENGLDLCAALVNFSAMSFVHLEQSAIRFIAYGADPARLRVIPHGIHDDRPRTGKEEARRSLGLSPDLKIAASFGFCEPHKGVLEIISELPAVISRHPEFAYVFLGGPSNNPSSVKYASICKQHAAHLGIENRVVFCDAFLSEDVVSSYLLASDLVIMNYLPVRNEISGAAAFALAHRRPMITSATPAFHYLTDCTLQLSIDMTIAHAVTLLLESPQLREHLVARTEKYIAHASYSELGRMLMCAYGIGRERI